MPTPASSKALWTGRILTTLVILFLLFDCITKMLKVPAVVQASAAFGYSANMIAAIGVILFICVIIYAIPQTSILGAILLTGYLGGATEAQLRVVGHFAFPILFSVVFGVVVWLGVFLRDPRVRALIPVRQNIP